MTIEAASHANHNNPAALMPEKDDGAGTQTGLWSLMPTTGVLEISATGRDVFGHVRPLTARQALRTVPPKDRGRVLDHMRHLLEGGAVGPLTLSVCASDGRHRLILVTGQGQTAARDGFVFGSLSPVPDRSDTGGGDAASALEWVGEMLLYACVTLTRRPSGQDRFDLWTQSAREIWNVPSDLRALDPAIFWGSVATEDLSRLQETLLESERALTPWQHRWRLTTPHGSVRTVEGRGQPQRQPDGATVWTMILFDVSGDDMPRVDALRHNALYNEMQLREAVTRITRIAGHDFNNLLTIIIGNGELIEDLDPSSPTDVYVSEILSAARRAQSLTRRLSQISVSGIEDTVLVNPGDSMRDLSGLLRRVLPCGIDFTTDFQTDLPQINVNRDMLDSAILNLVINARDALPQGGRIHLSARLDIRPEMTGTAAHPTLPAGAYVVFEVADNGAGIPPELLDAVLQPQVSSKPKEKGGGLGLAMVDGFARHAGGRVVIHSQPGGGTRMQIYIPVQTTDPMGHGSAMRSA